MSSAWATEPLAPAQLPDPLKSWVPWVMHGHEMLACPLAFNAPARALGQRACVWPSRLHIEAHAQGGSFRFEVEVLGAPALVSLPGQPGAWPQAVSVGGQPVAVGAQGQQPVLRLTAGVHVIAGRWVWAQMPQALAVPRDTGVLTLRVVGQPLTRAPDDQGRLWLQTPKAQTLASDALRVRTTRLVDDDVPLYVTTHYEIAVAGQTRELRLPAALLPGFVPVSLMSALPARVQDDGVLRLQVRPGNWTVQLRGRLMAPAMALTLPPGLPDEVWSFAAHNDLRVVSVEGLTAVDPKQVGMPAQWQSFAAYRIKAGQSMRWVQSQRGNPQPSADQLALRRTIWLDFDGGGYTFEDRITGQLSRSWQGQTGRLEMAAAGVLGRASIDGQD
ncbi:MAG TPA: hypothetical protein PLQ67_07410, partial [Burkholderiaceae bacterium]|nr:hypothetical protein [Burkholderiaceae bacterium]